MLRGEKAATKKMDTKASQEFLNELKVLTCVHHSNLVRLIGYCVESCLFLVYEFIENRNLSQHLHGTGYEPLSWTSRMQITLDSARGLKYIHEHTVPVNVHRDIKSANILIDRDLQAKVETIHVLAILCAIPVIHLAGCKFWTDKTFRNWNYITITPITMSCWYIWLHASRVCSIW